MAETLQEAKRLHKRTTWVPETTVLKPEDTEDRNQWSKSRIELRVAHCFSFWAGEKCVGFGPDIANSKGLEKITMRAMVASLNGDACYLAQAGEFQMEWPLRHYEHMKINNIREVRVDSHKSFRDGQSAVCAITDTHQYFLLQPDIFYEKKHWEADAKAWEGRQKGKSTLTFEDVSYKLPRPAWWKCEDSWRAWTRWAMLQNGEDAESNSYPKDPSSDDRDGGPEGAAGSGRLKRRRKGKQTGESNEVTQPQPKKHSKLPDRDRREAQQSAGASSSLSATRLGKRPISAVIDEEAVSERRAKIAATFPSPHRPRTRRSQTSSSPTTSVPLRDSPPIEDQPSASIQLATDPTAPVISSPVTGALPSPLVSTAPTPSSPPLGGEANSFAASEHVFAGGQSCEPRIAPTSPEPEAMESLEDRASQVVAVVSLLTMRSEAVPLFLQNSPAEVPEQHAVWNPQPNPQYIVEDGLVPPYTQNDYIPQGLYDIDFAMVLVDLDEMIARQIAGESGAPTIAAPFAIDHVEPGDAPDDIIIAEN